MGILSQINKTPTDWVMAIIFGFSRTQIRSFPALDPTSQNYQNIVKQVSPQDMCSIKVIDSYMVAAVAALPLEITL